MKHIKRNVTIAAVLLLVCAAVYLNWSYNNKWGTADPAMVKAEDAAMKAANEAYEAAILPRRVLTGRYRAMKQLICSRMPSSPTPPRRRR